MAETERLRALSSGHPRTGARLLKLAGRETGEMSFGLLSDSGAESSASEVVHDCVMQKGVVMVELRKV